MTEPTSKSPIISDLEFNYIYDIVLSHLPNFSSIKHTKDVWNDCLKYVKDLINHPQPQLYIYTIKNEIKQRTGYFIMKPHNVEVAGAISVTMYVALYYLKRGNEMYHKEILPVISTLLGDYNSPAWAHTSTLELLEQLPLRSQVKGPEQNTEDAVEDKIDDVSSRNQLCAKVLVRMFEKLWPKLNMSGCNNHQKARFLADISGYTEDVLYDRLSRRIQLTERDHKIDIEKANVHLNLIGIGRLLKCDINKSKK